MRYVSGCAGLLAALVLVYPATAQGPRSDKVVKASAKASKPDADGKQTVTITLDVEKPFHLYANPVGNKDFEKVATTVKVASKVSGATIDYPAGTVHKDKDVGDYKIYEGKVTIKASVRRARGDTGPLKLTVKLQACDSKRCLLPATIKLTAE